MRGQVFPVRVGMGIVAWGKGRFFLRMMRRVRMQVIQRVVLVFLCMAFLVLARVQCEVVRRVPRRGFGFMSWWHNLVFPLLIDKSAEGTRSFFDL